MQAGLTHRAVKTELRQVRKCLKIVVGFPAVGTGAERYNKYRHWMHCHCFLSVLLSVTCVRVDSRCFIAAASHTQKKEKIKNSFNTNAVDKPYKVEKVRP